MKKRVLITVWAVIAAVLTQAQVTQINSNKSLRVTFPLSNTKAIAVSDIDNSIWVTDGTLPGTFQISPDIKFEGSGTLLSGQFIFRGSTATTGTEIYITDGTIGGTTLVSDIYSGAPSSDPGDFILMNGYIYFSAVTPANGRELWRTDGTAEGTTFVKDIVPGPDGSNTKDQYNMFTNGSYLLFAAGSATTGVELWRSDGTDAGTNLLVDINTGNAGADSSKPTSFFAFNNIVLFTAKDIATGNEFYKTDGTAAGTVLLEDIYPGPAGSAEVEVFPGFSIPLFLGFHTFNNRVYFQASNGASTGEIWSTDGTTTTLLKDIVSQTTPSFIFVIDAINYPGKFIFPVSDGLNGTRSELWESDGTPGGTALFKSFTPLNAGDAPAILLQYSGDFLSGNFGQSFFKGDKFFFTAGTTTEGYELWLSDGIPGNTVMIKDIYANAAHGIDVNSHSYTHTSGALFFPANNGTNGLELWKSDGTPGGTDIVADIVTGPIGSDPQMSGFIVNGKVIFQADNGDSPTSDPAPRQTDLYAVDGIFDPLPIILADFTVAAISADAILNWHTQQEINSKDFTIQRSFDGGHFDNIGTVAAQGNSSVRHAYTFTDAGIVNSGQNILYYRLLNTDIDGKQAYSNVIALKLKSNQWSARLLANPVLGDARLALTGVTGKSQVTINDVNGKSVYRGKIPGANGIINIPVSSLPHGFYIMVITNGAEKKSIPFIK